MFTHTQSATLAEQAVATAGLQLSNVHVAMSGPLGSVRHQVSIYPAGWAPGQASFQGFAACPFEAIQAALDLAATVGVLSVAGIVAGTATLAAAAASFANAPAPQGPATCAAPPATAPRRISSKPATPAIVCAACGESEDPFGECRCSYVAVPESHYFNV